MFHYLKLSIVRNNDDTFNYAAQYMHLFDLARRLTLHPGRTERSTKPFQLANIFPGQFEATACLTQYGTTISSDQDRGSFGITDIDLGYQGPTEVNVNNWLGQRHPYINLISGRK